MPVQVNKAGVSHAKRLIEDGTTTIDSEWGGSQPSAITENRYLDKHGWAEYGKWFLAVDTSESEETKERYKFPYGDFKKVHRSGVIAAKQRAAQNDYGSIERAADDLLEMIDKEKEPAGKRG